MHTLTTHIERVKEYYLAPQLGFMVDSIVEGNTLAQVYVNDMEHPSIALVMEGHSVFFGGDPSDSVEVGKVVQFFKEKILDGPTKERLGILKLYPTSDVWQTVLMESLPEYNPTVYWRRFFRHHLQSLPGIAEGHDGVTVMAIDRDIVENTQLEYLQYMLGEIAYMWGGVEPFLANGFGSCAIKGDQLLCWCTGEYVSKKACGIGIETIEKFQGQKIATRTAAHFIHQSAERGLTPHWDSWKANLPSVRVAENVGFDHVQDYPIVFLKF